MPLREGERPPTLIAAIVVCALVALAVLIGVLTDRHLSEHGGSVPGGTFIAIVLALLALNMYRRRYWAVVGFQALLAFQIVVTCLLLLLVSNLLVILACLLALALGGALFWKLVRIMGRIQAGDIERRRQDA